MPINFSGYYSIVSLKSQSPRKTRDRQRACTHFVKQLDDRNRINTEHASFRFRFVTEETRIPLAKRCYHAMHCMNHKPKKQWFQVFHKSTDCAILSLDYYLGQRKAKRDLKLSTQITGQKGRRQLRKRSISWRKWGSREGGQQTFGTPKGRWKERPHLIQVLGRNDRRSRRYKKKKKN